MSSVKTELITFEGVVYICLWAAFMFLFWEYFRSLEWLRNKSLLVHYFYEYKQTKVAALNFYDWYW